MRVGIPREVRDGETRVALVPSLVPLLKRANHEVLVEVGAGAGSFVADGLYAQAGASIVEDAPALYAQADVIFKVQPPQLHPLAHTPEAEMVREGAAYIGLLSPFTRLDVLETFARRRVSAFAMELVPRIARAQSMDALSSMATIAGYKAVLLATERLGKMLPLLMTAAGTIAPATVLVLGAGVAGLQAIATAKRLGARVEAFDPRPAVREQVESLGATFIEMARTEESETAQGYAREQSADFLQEEMAAISVRLPKVDALITTAQVFGKRAPVLLTAAMVKLLHPGSVVVDLAAEQGGNCELTQPDQAVESDGVTIIGAVNLPATLPVDASQLYAHNVVNLFLHLYPDARAQPESADEIAQAVCVTRDGAVVNDVIRGLLTQGAPR